jgi:hypothetical protein
VRERQLRDLIEIDRALIGELELPGLHSVCAGEDAALVAEELGLEQSHGDRRAVDLHRMLPGARKAAWIALATWSFPAPHSPRISTVTSVSATSAMIRSIARI